MSTTVSHPDLIDQMTLDEKAALMSGANFWNTKSIDRLDIPSIMLTDGPHGLRKQAGAADHLGLNASVPATCFPTAATLANTWDRDLLFEIGAALGAEAAAENVSVLLGPGMNIKRNPLGGRNFEYFSEDPLLSGELAAAFVMGVQSKGVGASVKHFAVNSQETHRMSVDEVVDTRALHEIYLEGFRIAIEKAKPYTVMSAYNRVNGEYANESQELMTDVLRNRWGYKGLVVTDWGGSNDRVAGILASNALEMPSTGGITDAEIVDAVKTGALDERILDQRVDELLTLIDRTATARIPGVAPDLETNHVLAEQGALEGLVLLKNHDGALPLKPGIRVAVVGEFAQKIRIQGAGSSLVNPTRDTSPLEEMEAAGVNVIGFAPGYRRHGGWSQRMREEANQLARRADRVIFFAGLDESSEGECADRRHMHLPKNQLILLRDLIRAGHRITVVLVGGSPVELPFEPAVDSILGGYLSGQGAAHAIAQVLMGKSNPSGHLAETWPLTYEDVPSSSDFGLGETTQEHRESIYVGYRYYDKVQAPVRYCFGHGLSYTSFTFTDMVADSEGATVSVQNTGDRDGAEVVQVYLRPPTELGFVAPQSLQGFIRIRLAAGETKTVQIPFAEHAFDVFDVAGDDWRRIGGTYEVLIGSSSRDIRLRTTIEVKGEEAKLPYEPSALSSYYSGWVKRASDQEFATLLGRELPELHWDRTAPLNRLSILAETKGRGGLASGVHGLLSATQKALGVAGRPIDANQINFALDLPLRNLPRFSAGAFSEAALDVLLDALNGEWRRVFARARNLPKRLKTRSSSRTQEMGTSER
ncbi:glycoside hydrolase family 3 C-terminal domain-containing protein [Actinomycetaceae bacterium MB13-C1-2]|nr:glycoside hydrolase family 3 C-terminal domain-containing protein [Actinomycetaceae bacterium MB13-C1-2]